MLKIDSGSFRKNLTEWFNFDSSEHAASGVGIAVSEGARLRLALYVENDQAPATVCEWTGQGDLALRDERTQVIEMSGS